jgi:hypothetical protein
MWGFGRSKAVEFVELSQMPIGADNAPAWNDEVERKVIPILFGKDGSLVRDNISIKFRLNGVVTTGLAVFSFIEGEHRLWQARVVILPIMGERIAVTFDFRFAGEDRALPGGGVKMHWRSPTHETYSGIYMNIEESRDELTNLITQLDQKAEEVFKEAVEGSQEFQDRFLGMLRDSAEE